MTEASRPSAVILLLAAAAGLALAATPSPTPQVTPVPLPSSLIERVEVRFVTFDLIVERRGRGGWRPVGDLRKEEVTVLVGGVPMALELFEPHCGGAAEPLVADEASREGPAAVPQMVADPGEGTDGAGQAGTALALPAEPIRYILYFDLTQLTNGGANLAYKAALEWAEAGAKPNDEVMIVNGGELIRIIRPFLPASQRLREDILAARQASIRVERPAEFEDSRAREINDLFNITRRPEPPEGLAQAYGEEDYLRTRRSLSSLRSLMNLFDAIEGPKSLLLFESVLRQIPGGTYPYAQPEQLSSVDPDLRQLAQAANEREVRIYGVHAEGLEGLADSAVTFLASETGGRVIERTNTLVPAFTRVVEDASCFYRVGFPLAREHSGNAERIEVRVGDGRGTRVRHRRTLLDPTREEIEVDALRAALLQPERAHAVVLSAAAWPLWSGAGGGRARLEVRTALAGVAALPGAAPGAREARVQIGVTLIPLRPLEPGEVRLTGNPWMDAAPNRPPWNMARQAALKLPPEWQASADPREIVLAQEVDLPAGDYRLVAVVQDRLANTVGSALADLTIPEAGALLGPIHLASDDARGLPAIAPAGEEEPEPGGHRKEIRPAAPALPPRTWIHRDAIATAGVGVSVTVGLCAVGPERPPRDREEGAPAAFEGWVVRRSLACGGVDRPLLLADAPLPSPGAEGCALLVDPLPSDALPSGPCVYEVTLERPGEGPLSQRLEFRVE